MPSTQAENEYWSGFYSAAQLPVLPSQFAAFVANELLNGDLGEIDAILEAGCGNGRDALFFLRHGYRVHAMDASPSAVESCNQQLAQIEPEIRPRARFLNAPADERASWQKLAEGLEGRLLVYTRFFFHAIDEQAQDKVLDAAAELIRQRGGALCVEARTDQDASLSKVTPEHYRRFIRPDDFAAAVASRGLEVTYRAEGYGMAKYKQDNAHVFRLVARG